jgi:quercetin dioxygenase-like cupin family protein
MEKPYAFVENLVGEVQIPKNGILSRTLYNDDRTKAIVFGFDSGQELSAHTAPMPAVIQILDGEASIKLGGDVVEGRPGTWIHMAPQLEHGIHAKTPVVMLLLLLKQPN